MLQVLTFCDYHKPMTDIPVIAKLGGREAVKQMIEDETGKRLKPSTIPMWVNRKAVPGRYRVLLAQLAARDGVDVDWKDFELSDSDERPAA